MTFLEPLVVLIPKMPFSFVPVFAFRIPFGAVSVRV